MNELRVLGPQHSIDDADDVNDVLMLLQTTHNRTLNRTLLNQSSSRSRRTQQSITRTTHKLHRLVVGKLSNVRALLPDDDR